MDTTSENGKSSKRIRNPKKHKRQEMKSKRTKGEEYENYKGIVIAAKKFQKVICKCRKACHFNVPENEQKQIFEEYWNLSTWTQKTTFLLNNIRSSDCVHRRKPENRKNIQFKKSFNREYSFGNARKKVCKKFFMAVLQIKDTRIEKCVQKKQLNLSDCTIDRRGKHTSHKKTPADKIRGVIQFIASLPQYESHYVRTRDMDSGRKYLSPNLNLKMIYNEYKTVCDEKNERPVSNYMFRDVFYRKFNLKFKPPKQDSCNYCDSMKYKIDAAPIKTIERMNLIKDREEHWDGVRYLDREMKEYVADSRLTAGEKIVLVFDLEKVLETPKLASNRVYFSRQLSTYNLCIHDETQNRTYMYLWHEGIASKGPQEVASCLIYHMHNFIPSECKHLFLFSDSTGAQNRNIKVSAMLSHTLEKSQNLMSITQHFYRSGHSYNVCDRKFAIIEKKRKKVDTIYVPSEWKTLIENAKESAPKFHVVEMKSKDFFSCDQLMGQFCTNRKKTVDKSEINWFTFRKIAYKKGHPMNLFFETYADVWAKYDERYEFKPDKTKLLSVAKKGIQSDEFIRFELPILYPDGRAIATNKKMDLLNLLDLIPAEHRSFYTNLNNTDEEEQIERPIEEIVILSDDDD